MGVCQDMRFIHCYWPKLDRPTRIFAVGSSGIEVLGRTPRNVWFPDDVVFLEDWLDARYPAEQAVLKAFPFRRGLINLSPVEAQIWMDAYDAAVAKLNPGHTHYATPRECNFLRHREEKSRRSIMLAEDSVQTHEDGSKTVLAKGSTITKIEYEEFVANLSAQECADIVDGKVDEVDLRAAKTFVHISEVRVVDGVKHQLTLAEWRAEKDAVK